MIGQFKGWTFSREAFSAQVLGKTRGSAYSSPSAPGCAMGSARSGSSGLPVWAASCLAGRTARCTDNDPVADGSPWAPGGVSCAETPRHLLPRNRMRVADAAAAAAHQIHMDVIVVIDVRSRRKHRRELIAGRALHVAQEALLFRQTVPAILHGDRAPIGQCESRDVQRVAEGMLGDTGIGVAIHAAARIGGDLLDLGYRRAEPAQCSGLHGACDPAIELRYDGACESCRRIDGHGGNSLGDLGAARAAERNERRHHWTAHGFIRPFVVG